MRLLPKPLRFALIPILCCIFSAPAFAGGPVPVAVSIIPQKYFVEKIGGSMVEVEVMVPPGATPEQYEPKPKQMSALGGAVIYFALGVPFETAWLSKMAEANPKMRIIHTEKDIEKRRIEGHSHGGPAKASGESHAHEETEVDDPHVWLSPPLVMLQARAIFEALTEADPQNRPSFETNYKNFISELVDLDASFLRLFQSAGGDRTFMVFHPAWGYFADAYGLKQAPVEVEGREPRARDLDEFIKMARRLGIKTIFVQPQYSPKSAQVIAEAVGAGLVTADDLAPDWADNLRRVADQFSAALARR